MLIDSEQKFEQIWTHNLWNKSFLLNHKIRANQCDQIWRFIGLWAPPLLFHYSVICAHISNYWLRMTNNGSRALKTVFWFHRNKSISVLVQFLMMTTDIKGLPLLGRNAHHLFMPSQSSPYLYLTTLIGR